MNDDLTDLISNLRHQIRDSMKYGEPEDECSFSSEQGVILTRKEAQIIVDLIDSSEE